MNVLKAFRAVLTRHHVSFWATLALAWVFQIGMWTEYRDFRTANAAWVLERTGFNMPETFPLWWFAIPFVAWVLTSSLWHQVRHELISPRLLFQNLRVERIVFNGGGHAYLAKVDVINAPYSPKEESMVGKALCRATFTNRHTSDPSVEAYGARWLQNLKPRDDEFPKDMVPKFRDDINYRDLTGNRAISTIDFAIVTEQSSFFCAMTAASQSVAGWHDVNLSAGPGTYDVILEISGVGLEKPAKAKLVLTYPAGGVFEVSELHRA